MKLDEYGLPITTTPIVFFRREYRTGALIKDVVTLMVLNQNVAIGHNALTKVSSDSNNIVIRGDYVPR